MYIDLFFSRDLHASGQMIANISSWNTLTQSVTLLPNYTIMPSPFPLPSLGFKSATLQSSHMKLSLLEELKLDGEHVPAQFHWIVVYGLFQIGTTALQLGLILGTSSFSMQSLAPRQLFFLDTQME